jgi:RimJ/RimL family protein N-acetyltransferase
MEIKDFNPNLRLRLFTEDDIEHALKWYADPVVLTGSVSPDQKNPFTHEMLSKMYKDLGSRGELYVIEAANDGGWLPIGEVAIAQKILPIVIGDPAYRGKKIAKRILQHMISYARSKSWDKLSLKGIYKNNIASQALYESCGFKRVGENTKCYLYELILEPEVID